MEKSHETNKITFEEFRKYCLKVQKNLNQIERYSAKYAIKGHSLMKGHDAQYLQVQYREEEQYIVKINFCFSIAYQVPIFFFMVYNENSQPLTAELLYEKFMRKNQIKQLHPKNQSYGIFLSQNPITRQYFYTLHHCQMQMKINHLIPFYFSLLGLHPQMVN